MKRTVFHNYCKRHGTSVEKMAKIKDFPFGPARLYVFASGGAKDVSLGNALDLYNATLREFGEPLCIWDIIDYDEFRKQAIKEAFKAHTNK